jgi:hypothetical protein
MGSAISVELDHVSEQYRGHGVSVQIANLESHSVDAISMENQSGDHLASSLIGFLDGGVQP